jgi:hypothetical protein
MSILNTEFVRTNISNNHIVENGIDGKEIHTFEDVKYRWTHGATDLHLGDGLIIYALIQNMRAKTCVCLGSGGGFIPRIMTQARVDLHEQKIFNGSNSMEWGDIGTTILVDACNGVGGDVDWLDIDSFFRYSTTCRIVKDTTVNAFYNFFVKEDIKIDYLHIDAGHTYEDVKKDFDLYKTILSEHGIISIHDTDSSYEQDLIITEDVKDQNNHQSWNGPSRLIKELKENKDWEVFNLFNNGILRTKPASTGLTLLQRCKK